MSEAREILPVFKTVPTEIDRLLQRLKEKLAEFRREVVKDENIDVVISLQNLFMDLVSSTTSDVIISPMVGEQTLLNNAYVISSYIASVRERYLEMFLKTVSDKKDEKEVLKHLMDFLNTKSLSYLAMILVLVKRLTHIYVNMPSDIRPSLANAMIGFDIIEMR